VICFKCNKQLEPAFGDLPDDHLTPRRGLIFEATGNFGSRIFDPTITAPQLVVWICDDCIVEHKDQVKVRDYAVVQREVIWRDYDPMAAYW
jgi:hypothetical protein